MHDTLEKSYVSVKLQKEMSNLAILQESLNKSEKMKDSMLGILTTFEKRLTKLEDTIMPIYQETGNLQRRHENIEKTIAVLDHVIGYYNVAEEVEPVMRDGPGTNLQMYIESLNRLSKAVKFLVHNNPGSPAMAHVIALYDAGKESLEKEFHNLLSQCNKPIHPLQLIESVSNEEDEKVSSSSLSPPSSSSLSLASTSASYDIVYYSEDVMGKLKLISSWLLESKYESNLVQSYVRVRSEVMAKNLRDLKNHLKVMPSRDTSLALGAMSQSPSVKGKLRETPKKTLKRGFVTKASSFLKKQQEHAAYRPTSGTLRDENLDVDCNSIIIVIPCLVKLINAENSLMTHLIPEKSKMKVYDHLMLIAVDFLCREAEHISQMIKRSPTRHNNTPVTMLLPVLRQLTNYSGKYDALLKDCQSTTKAKYLSVGTSLQATGSKALDEFVDSIRNDADKSSMPRDGTVHELTSNAMFFMEQLLEYSDVVGCMLLFQEQASSNGQNAERWRLKLAEFFTKVLSALGLNLNNKAESYNDIALRAIFMLNNFNYVLNLMKRSGMMDVVHLWNAEVQSFYEDQITNQKRIYSQSWSGVLHFISENQRPISSDLSPESKLKDKDRNAIKEKFAGFNRELEEICRQQKTFSVPDPDLRQSLIEDNKSFILPFYSSFLKRYRNVNFTKNPDKYIKYSEEDLIECFSGFFDASA